MWLIKLIVQILSLFLLMYIGFVVMKETENLFLILLYWIFYVIINIITAGWRMNDSNYNLEKDFKTALMIQKKCPHCFKSLPSHFTSKCPHCTKDL